MIKDYILKNRETITAKEIIDIANWIMNTTYSVKYIKNFMMNHVTLRYNANHDLET